MNVDTRPVIDQLTEPTALNVLHEEIERLHDALFDAQEGTAKDILSAFDDREDDEPPIELAKDLAAYEVDRTLEWVRHLETTLASRLENC
jgi:hypothetical protein